MYMNKILTYSFVIVIILGGCRNIDKVQQSEGTIPESSSASIPFEGMSVNEHMVMATLYHQQSAEYVAACQQAYNLCKMILDNELMNQNAGKSLAVVLDIDETVLDNSPYQAECVLENISYPTRWDEWCNLAIAKPVPGALSFVKYAESKGVSAFFVTNRREHLKVSTIKNLQDQGFPFADSIHVIMRKQEASKESRRRVIQEKYDIVILVGDNLSDLSLLFDDKSNDERSVEVEKMPKDFGANLVIIPNAMYGDWENDIYNHVKDKKTNKIKLRHESLRGF